MTRRGGAVSSDANHVSGRAIGGVQTIPAGARRLGLVICCDDLAGVGVDDTVGCGLRCGVVHGEARMTRDSQGARKISNYFSVIT